jgi:hypothetical protein
MVHLNEILNSRLFGMDEKKEDSTMTEIMLDETFKGSFHNALRYVQRDILRFAVFSFK